MTRIISALLLALTASVSISLTQAADNEPPAISENAPDRHVVVRGDTLWDISAKFLKEPWRWPEIWRMNSDQIKNPNRIYPGDIVVLDRDASGKPILRLGSSVKGKRGKSKHDSGLSTQGKLEPQIYSEDASDAIPSIPAHLIEPFISEPLIVDDITVNNGARISALQIGRVHLSTGDKAFVTGASHMPQQELWQIYRPGKPLIDPENGQTLGFEAFYLGTAIQQKTGEPATFEIRSFKQEIGRGDRLLPAVSPQLINYVPHKPTVEIHGRVAAVYGGVGAAGRGSVITLNRGTNAGIEIGHVLALYRNRVDTFRNPETDEKETVVLPPERYGLIFVFRTFQRVAYALVVQSAGAVAINDYLQNP